MAAECVITIGTRRIGMGHPTYIIAEAGVNHRCRLDLALDMIRQAKQAGADAIKFQTYKAESLVTRSAPRYWEDEEKSGTQFAIFKQSDHFGPDEYRRMADCCMEQGIDFLSTPFDLAAVDLLDEIGVPAFKIASADLTNAVLLRRIAGTAKPVLQSTGASTLEEIREWVTLARGCGVRDVCLLHCVLCYPTNVTDANLRRISLLAEHFPDAVIGYSDHTDAARCTAVSAAAVALGARLIEKHFTLDRTWPGDDHYHSVDPDLLADMVRAVRATEQSLGSEYEGILQCEEPARVNARRSIVTARPIHAGETVSEDMLIMKRPGTGIPPTELPTVVGKKAVRDIAQDRIVSWDDLS